MQPKLDINSTLQDLELVKVELDCEEKLFTAFKVFESDFKIPGIIITKNGHFFRMLSKSKFYQIMSKQYMFDLFSRRPVYFFFDESIDENYLILEKNSAIVEASIQALLRDEKHRYDPIIVKTENDYLLLSINTLLLAQNDVHKHALEIITHANEFKKDVLRIVTHDLRSPLSAVMGFGELIIKENESFSEMKEYAGHILTSANQMNSLINEFMTMAINDSLDFEMSYSVFNVKEAICYVISSLLNSAKVKQQKLKYVSVDESITVSADRNKFIEVIFNLITNAIKYSPPSKYIFVDAYPDSDQVIISVKDEGLGLSEEDLSKVFGKFQKLSAKPTANEPSVGLGLYIVKKIIDKHGGNIWVKSELGQGSTFYVALPV